MRVRKRFGQHFLQPDWIAKVVHVVEPRPGDTVLEIGPGTGALTRPLAREVARIIAIEIDRDLASALVASAPSNVDVVTGDFLEADVPAVLQRAQPPSDHSRSSPTPVRVVGNLPYNVSSPILFRILDLYDRYRLFSDATLMLQREVADRLLAPPGTRAYGVLGILVALRATVTPLLTLPPGAFRPAPRVTSSVVRLVFHPPRVAADPVLFERVVRGLFQHRRKTLANCTRSIWPPDARTSPAEGLAKAVLDPRRRPETLDLAELARLVASYASARPGDVV